MVELVEHSTLSPQHQGQGFGHAWSPSNDRVTVATWGDGVSVIGTETQSQLASVAHGGTVPCVAWSRDGSLIASGTSAGEVWLFTPAGEVLARLGGHTGEVRSVAFSPDGARLASVANDGTLRVWTRTSPALLWSEQAHSGIARAVAWSPDGSVITTCGHDNCVRVWQADTGQLLGGLSDHQAPVSKVGFSPSGDRLLSGGMDGTVRVWNLQRSQYDHVIDAFDGWWVLDFAVSPDGTMLAALDQDPAIRLFDLASGNLLTRVALPFGTQSIGWSPGGQFVSTVGHQLKIWRW